MMAPAEASPEVAVHAAEAAVLALAPCMVVASSNTCPACCVTVEETVDKQCTCPVSELYMFPDATTVEPPEVSVVTVCKTLSCPVTATKAVCELLSSSESATEAVY